ncbi:MAG: flippase-like domain-containing protein [Thermoplasmatota archaeon]
MEVKKWRRRLKILSLLIFFIVGAVLLFSAGPEILRELRGLNPWYVFLAITCYLGLHLAWGIKFFLLVKRKVKRAYFPFVMLANMAGNFINVTTPSGRLAGEPFRAKWISSRYGARFSTVFAAAMMDKLSFTLAMLALLIPLSIYAAVTFHLPLFMEIITIFFVIFWVMIGIGSYFFLRGKGEKRSMRIGAFIYRISRFILGTKSKDRSYFIEKARSGIKEFKSSLAYLAQSPMYMSIDIVLAFLIFGSRFAAAYMFFLATGNHIGFLSVSTVVMIAFAIGLLSQMPGMVGIAESTMWGLYLAVGVSPTLAIAVSVLTQMNSYIFEIGLGYVAMFVMNVMASRDRKRRQIRASSG